MSQHKAMVKKIPPKTSPQDPGETGQPILVGHHSERADRGYRARIERTYEKSRELAEKSEYYEKKASNAEDAYAIRSDDPDAIVKLKEKIMALEKRKEHFKGVTEESLHEGKPHLRGLQLRQIEIDSCNRGIRDAKKRVDAVQQARSIPATKKTINGVYLVVDQSDNRVKLFFPSIPSQETRTKLKRNGWHWSPQNQAWQRQINNSTLYSAEEILKSQGS